MVRSRFQHLRSLSSLPLSILKTQQYNQTLLQCNKTIQRLGELGRVNEARQLFDSMPHKDTVSWNSMISVYIQNHSIRDAQSLFNSFKHKNLRTWTILLSGYAKVGLIDDAKAIFEAMPEHNVVSWNALVSGYVANGDLVIARKLFDEMPERNVSSWNSMIMGYSRSGLIREARELFDRMGERSCVSWMLMVLAYVEACEYKEGWLAFVEMMRGRARPDQAVLSVVLSVIVSLNDSGLIGSLRTIAMKIGYEGDVVVGTAILNAYTRIGDVDTAFKFFEAMPVRNEYSWSNMISAFSQCGRLDDAIVLYQRSMEMDIAIRSSMLSAYMQWGRVDDARKMFDEIGNPSVVAWNAMIAGYAQNGLLKEAEDIFLRMPNRNSVSWSAMIAGFVQNGSMEEGLKLFAELHGTGMIANRSCFTSAIMACANIGDVEKGRQLHSYAFKTSCQSNSYVGNSLISMYAKFNNMADASRVFNSMKLRDTTSWNALISGFSQNCMLNDAQMTFEKMPTRDVVSWTAIISAYVQAGQAETPLKLFLDMLSAGVKPKDLTVTKLLSACGSLGATTHGKQFHGLVFKHGFDSFLCVSNALITMYFKCGNQDGLNVFKEMLERDIMAWNAVLAGCAQNGLAKEAIKIFKQMEAAGVLPDERSFSGVLRACSHAKLVDEGWAYFISMSQDYGIIPSIYHYTCMVGLLGRAGQLAEAEALIESMPIKADCMIWEALLTACEIHDNIELGQRVAETLVQMETQRFRTYIFLTNLYSSQGMWDQVGEIKELMKHRGVTKEPGMSCIWIKNNLHCFLGGDENHGKIEEIHLALKEYYRLFRGSSHVKDQDYVSDIEEEENELLYHSVKLALIYGVLKMANSVPIQIMNNFRSCGDCHSFTKYMSKVTQHTIIIRDGHQFHHIHGGSCSCGDYW